jgi:hypothetical protein
LGHNATDCHHNCLQKSTKKNKETFNLNDFGKFYRKEQKKKRAHTKPSQQRQSVLTLLKVAMSATHSNPEGDPHVMQPLIRRCTVMIAGNAKEPPTNEITFMLNEEEEDLSNFTKDTWCADSTVSTHM